MRFMIFLMALGFIWALPMIAMAEDVLPTIETKEMPTAAPAAPVQNDACAMYSSQRNKNMCRARLEKIERMNNAKTNRADTYKHRRTTFKKKTAPVAVPQNKDVPAQIQTPEKPLPPVSKGIQKPENVN